MPQVPLPPARPFRRVLIANRGEIALRIVRACRLLGLETVAVFSEADRTQPHLALADQALCIGPAAARSSYLDGERILRAARLTGADAIHPGYGFLSENPDFAAATADAGLVFIGPTAPVMREMGDKIAAKGAMHANGVPCLPGSDGAMPDAPEAARAVAAAIGYPLIIKAAAGGGGRGMRIVQTDSAFHDALAAAREEAGRAFKNSTVYAERFLQRPRHIEIQVLSDAHGTAVWLGARDCSIQRRHQKLVEEAPAPGIDPALIAALGESCARACEKIGYLGAGTFEFLFEDGIFAFIEMNTRLQVEHPVTEAVTGIDIVREQLLIAMGHPLSFRQSDITTTGHAIECRLNAEHPEDFRPSPGCVTRFRAPGGPGMRTDTFLEPGVTVPATYDSLVAKLIVHGRDRDEAIARMRAALDDTMIEGITTLIPLHRRLMDEPAFRDAPPTVHTLENDILGKPAT